MAAMAGTQSKTCIFFKSTTPLDAQGTVMQLCTSHTNAIRNGKQISAEIIVKATEHFKVQQIPFWKDKFTLYHLLKRNSKMENPRGHEKGLYFLKPYTRDREHSKKRFRMVRSTWLPLYCNPQQMFTFKYFEDLMGGCELSRESALRRGFLEADNSAAECIGGGGGMKSAFCGRTRGTRARATVRENN